jgi:hypothetical protein
MVQVIEHLLIKLEALSSNPSTTHTQNHMFDTVLTKVKKKKIPNLFFGGTGV